MDDRSAIKKCPLFAGVTDQDLDQLTSVCRRREYNKGEVLFSEKEPADGFYVVVEGNVKVYKLSSEGKERILHIVHPGESFAEAAMFADGCYPAFAEPVRKATVLFFPKQPFIDLLQTHTRIPINMIAGLSRFLRQFAGQIEDLTFKDVPARLARYLVELAEDGRDVVELPIFKTQLASRLGTVSETLSRTLRKLSEDELIKVQGKTITILDHDRLEDLAESSRESL